MVDVWLAGAALLTVALVGALLAGRSWRNHRRTLDQIGRLDRALAHHGTPDLSPLDGTDGAMFELGRQVRDLAGALSMERENLRRLERAVRAIPDGLVLADERGEVVFRNDVAAEFAGGRHSDALVDAAVRDLLAEALAEGSVGSRTLDLFGPPRRTIVVSARPVLADGVAAGALAIIEDITDKRRLEAIRRDFVANISHELKTPVGALSLLAETIADEVDPVVSRRLAERMVTEATRLGHTIEDLLALSRLESDEAPAYDRVRVDGVVSEAIERILPAATNAGIGIDVDGPDGPVEIRGDRRQLVSALYNLLDNAVKYSDQGSGVVIRITSDDRDVRLAVADRGIGIPARDLERVFERFYRVDQARSRQTGGTGLGLSIVRHVMANHAGEVVVESRLGTGSTFILRLPLANPTQQIGDQ